jgi:hypothetical protein
MVHYDYVLIMSYDVLSIEIICYFYMYILTGIMMIFLECVGNMTG